MHYPRALLGTLGAIALTGSTAQASEEIFNPPASLQSLPVQNQITVIAPSADVVVPAVSGDTPAPATNPATNVVVVPWVSVEAPAMVSSGALTSKAASAEPANSGESQSTSDTAADGSVGSPAAGLNGTIALDAKSVYPNCPLKTEMLAMTPSQVAQASSGACPRPPAFEALVIPEPFKAEASPALSIYIPVGFGLDGWSAWGSGNYQAGVREDTGSVGGGGIGVGLGDARKYVGLELGYTFVDGDFFGVGGFSGKLHRRFTDDLSVAFGWNGFANPTRNDFEQSIYGVVTKVFRLADSLDKPFSRIAMTVGVGNGQFRSNLDRDQFQNGTNVFGNLVFRIIRPVSLIAEWTGQDIGLGLSIAPFKNLPFVITPAVRDVTGSGYGARFVLGAGVSFKF